MVVILDMQILCVECRNSELGCKTPNYNCLTILSLVQLNCHQKNKTSSYIPPCGALLRTKLSFVGWCPSGGGHGSGGSILPVVDFLALPTT